MHQRIATILLAAGVLGSQSSAQGVLFDFDNAPLYTPIPPPLDVTVSGITARLSATGQGYSIQNADVMGFTPQGFGGRCIYPSSVYLADLLISFSVPMVDFAIMYAPQELGCDDSATMRVTAYMDATYVGTSTTTAPNPGTWPTGLLTFTSTNPFNNVVVHYDQRPPTCQDYGTIFMADNMTVTPAPSASWTNYGSGWAGTHGVPAFVASGNPCCAARSTLDLANSLGASTVAALLIGLTRADLPTVYGGHVLLLPITAMMLSLPAGGLPLAGAIPCDGALSGLAIDLQALEIDPGASRGVSFTRGLELVLGS
ncbi:MAG: hypothetical protein U1E76_16170 [Planctomycetota bacterium]